MLAVNDETTHPTVVSQSLLQVMYGQFSMISDCQCGEFLRWSEAAISDLAFADHMGCFDSGKCRLG